MQKVKELPTTLEAITAEWLTAALREGGCIQASVVRSLNKKRFGQDEAFTGGSLIHITIDYDRPEAGAPHSLVAKLAPTDPELLALMKPNNLREVQFYGEFSKQKRMAVPRCYYADSESVSGKTILLLEDLSGCRSVDYVNGCEAADVELVIQAFAEIHGRWWDDSLVMGLSGSDVIQDFPYADFWEPYPNKVAELLPSFKVPESFFEIGSLIGQKV